MRVLVTGASGFLGGTIGRLLSQKGYAVIGIGRKLVKETDFAFYHRGDILDDDFLASVARMESSVDVIIHAAACISFDPCMEEQVMRVNIIGTKKIMRLAALLRAKQIIFLSSIPVIGKPKYHPITEVHPLHPDTVYHVSKLSAEYLLQAGDIPTIILRVPSPVGIGMNPNTILSVFVSQCLEGKDLIIYGTGSRIQSYLAAEDIARATELALCRGGMDLYHLAGEQMSNLELAKLCQKVIGSAGRIVVGSKPDSHDEEIWDVSGEKAARDLGFMPRISLEYSIHQLLEAKE